MLIHGDWLIRKLPLLDPDLVYSEYVVFCTVFQIELVCCLLSKHEKSGGGAGSLNVVYVADGTGFANSPAGGELDQRRDAALTKGMRYALGIPDWSPRDQRPPPYPAHLKVEIVANSKEVSGRARLSLASVPLLAFVCLFHRSSASICYNLAPDRELGLKAVANLHPFS